MLIVVECHFDHKQMGLLLQCDLGNHRDMEHINISGGLLWVRQFRNVIALLSTDAWRGFSSVKE